MFREETTTAIAGFRVMFPGRTEIWICRGPQGLDLH